MAVRTLVTQILSIGYHDLGEGPIRSVSTARAKLIVPVRSEAVLDGLSPGEALQDLVQIEKEN